MRNEKNRYIIKVANYHLKEPKLKRPKLKIPIITVDTGSVFDEY